MKKLGSLDVGGIPYQIYMDEEHKDENLEGNWAYTDCYNRKIVINKDTGDCKDFALFHELIHCAANCLKASAKMDSEGDVRPFSHILYGLVKEANKKGLLKFRI